MMLKHLDVHMEKMSLNSYTYTNINSRQIMDLNVKAKAIKLLKNKKIYLSPESGHRVLTFLHKTQKVITMKEKFDELDIIKILNTWLLKQTIKKMYAQVTDQKKIFIKHRSDTGLYPEQIFLMSYNSIMIIIKDNPIFFFFL